MGGIASVFLRSALSEQRQRHPSLACRVNCGSKLTPLLFAFYRRVKTGCTTEAALQHAQGQRPSVRGGLTKSSATNACKKNRFIGTLRKRYRYGLRSYNIQGLQCVIHDTQMVFEMFCYNYGNRYTYTM